MNKYWTKKTVCFGQFPEIEKLFVVFVSIARQATKSAAMTVLIATALLIKESIWGTTLCEKQRHAFRKFSASWGWTFEICYTTLVEINCTTLWRRKSCWFLSCDKYKKNQWKAENCKAWKLYSFGETGMCLKLFRWKSYVMKHDDAKSLQDFKSIAAKDSVTEYLCINADYYHKVKSQSLKSRKFLDAFELALKQFHIFLKKHLWSDPFTFQRCFLLLR